MQTNSKLQMQNIETKHPNKFQSRNVKRRKAAATAGNVTITLQINIKKQEEGAKASKYFHTKHTPQTTTENQTSQASLQLPNTT